MTIIRLHYAVILLLVLVLSSSCGPTDDGAAGGGTGIAGGGIGGTGISFGQITGFGSIIINDMTFNIVGAVITADDRSVTEAELGLGDVCLVQGLIDQSTASGTATSVVCDDNLEGPVTDTRNAGDGVITVLGQTIRVDATTPTIFDGFNALEDLAVGDVVEVHGFLDPVTEAIQATRIEREATIFTPGLTAVEIKGTVTNFNGRDQFDIGGLTVQLTPSTEVDVAGGIADGKFVEVKGTLNAAADVLTPTKVEDENDNPLADADPGAEVEVEGLISEVSGLGDFKVNGVPVNAQNAVFEGGNEADLANGVKVEVEGTFNDAGVLVAEKVDIKQESDIRIEANIVGTPTASSLDIGVGPAVLTVHINDATKLQDKTDANSGALQLTDIIDGERVKIRAFTDPVSGDIIATRLEAEGFEDVANQEKLRGPVDKDLSADPIVTIIGVEVNTTGFDNADFADDVSDIGRDAFFDRLNAEPNPVAEAVDVDPPDGTFDKIELKD